MALETTSAELPRLRIAVDIGGTFTDVAAFDEASGELLFGKALSTHDELVDGIQNTLDGAGVAFATRTCSCTARPSPSTRCSSAPAPGRRC